MIKETRVFIAPIEEDMDLMDAPYSVEHLFRLTTKEASEGEIISIPLGYKSNVFQNYPNLRKKEVRYTKLTGYQRMAGSVEYKTRWIDEDRFLHGELKLRILKTEPKKKIKIDKNTKIIIYYSLERLRISQKQN